MRPHINSSALTWKTQMFTTFAPNVRRFICGCRLPLCVYICECFFLCVCVCWFIFNVVGVRAVCLWHLGQCVFHDNSHTNHLSYSTQSLSPALPTKKKYPSHSSLTTHNVASHKTNTFCLGAIYRICIYSIYIVYNTDVFALFCMFHLRRIGFAAPTNKKIRNPHQKCTKNTLSLHLAASYIWCSWAPFLYLLDGSGRAKYAASLLMMTNALAVYFAWWCYRVVFYICACCGHSRHTHTHTKQNGRSSSESSDDTERWQPVFVAVTDRELR